MSESKRTFKEYTEIAKSVLQELGKRGVTLTPDNFKVWFEYRVGSDEELVNEIDELVASGKPFTEAINRHLYDKYFGTRKEERIVSEIQQATQKILHEVFEEILSQGNSTARYSGKLKEYSEKLKSAKELSEVKTIVEKIIEDTSEIEASSHAIQKRLKKATTDAENLRNRIEMSQREVLEIKDPLTNLYNRKALDKKLKDLHNEFKNGNNVFSVIMLDIDLFKRINDKYGNAIGDEIIKIIASKLKECVKGRDFTARYGDDEFVILLPMTILENATILAENIRNAVFKKVFKLKKTGERIGVLSVSIGVSQIHSTDTTNSVIERAEEALNLAQNAGRNIVKSESDIPNKKI
jgi:diguanylate cyclase